MPLLVAVFLDKKKHEAPFIDGMENVFSAGDLLVVEEIESGNFYTKRNDPFMALGQADWCLHPTSIEIIGEL